MDVIETDVVIVGAGGAGLRAAIAVAEADPSLNIALTSKVVDYGPAFVGQFRRIMQ